MFGRTFREVKNIRKEPKRFYICFRLLAEQPSICPKERFKSNTNYTIGSFYKVLEPFKPHTCMFLYNTYVREKAKIGYIAVRSAA